MSNNQKLESIIIKHELVEWKLLRPFQPDSLKKTTKSRMEKLERSLIATGFAMNFYVFQDAEKNLWVFDGHHRLKALENLERKGFDVPDRFPGTFLNVRDESHAKKIILAFNSHYAELQKDGVLEFISDLDFDEVDSEFELFDLGFELPRQTDDDPAADEVPEMEDQTDTVIGDLFEIKSGSMIHRVMCGDCTDKNAVDFLIGGSKIDMTSNDPPYGIKEKGDRSETGSKRGGTLPGGKYIPGRKYRDIINDDSIDVAVKSFEIVQSLKIKRQVWWGANYYSHFIPMSNNWFVWDKRVEENLSNDNSDCELAWVKSKFSSIRIFRHKWSGIVKDSEHGKRRVHPTQKPVALFEWSFDYFKDVSTVLDLFLGSGPTLIACQKTGRSLFGMEIDPFYIDIILRRYADYCIEKDMKFKIFKNGIDISENFISNAK